MEDLTLSDCLIILRRRKAAFLCAFCLIFAGAVALAMLWSNYRSNAMIEIEQPQVASEITTPLGMNPNDAPESLADLRVNRIRQKVTSQSSLIDIITKYNLYPGMRASEPIAVVADKMANKIKLKLISSEIANPNATQKVSADQLSAIAFNISFDYDDPEMAQKITNELVTRFLDQDLKDRHSQSEVTNDFIDKQIKLLEASLVEQEKKIGDFESKNGVSRPETLMFNQQAAANVALSLQNLDSQIATNEGTQGALRAQLASVEPYSRVIADGQVVTTPAIQLKALKSQFTTLTAQYGPEHPDVLKLKRQIQALQESQGSAGGTMNAETGELKSQITDVRTNLKVAEKTYGPNNPDVISLKNQLESLKKKLAEAKRNSSAPNSFHQDADNPAYIEVVSQLRSAEEQHKSLLEQREKLQAQEEKYQQAVMQNPVLQQQMATLTRDYDNAQLRYRDLKQKKMAADMDKQMIEDRHGQRLMVISPPELPTHTQPRRVLILLGGFMVACMGGFVTVILRQMMTQAIFGPRQLTALVGVPPLVVVPHLRVNDDRNQNLLQRSQAVMSGSRAKQITMMDASEERVS